MTNEELVKALRGKFIAYDATGNHKSAQLYKDAAAAIEELQTEVKRLEPKRGEIVRCRECRWGYLCVTGQHLGLDGFCSKGEREVQE